MTRGRPAVVFSDKIIPLLGRMPDSQVARLAKCSPPTVKSYRLKHNIPAYSRDDEEFVDAINGVVSFVEGKEVPPAVPTPDLVEVTSTYKKQQLENILTGLRDASKKSDGWLLSTESYAEILNGVLRLYYDAI